MYQDFDHRFSLKALTYFEDGDLKNLSSETRQTLIRAVQNFQQPEEMLKQSDFLYETSKVKFKHSSKRRFKL